MLLAAGAAGRLRKNARAGLAMHAWASGGHGRWSVGRMSPVSSSGWGVGHRRCLCHGGWWARKGVVSLSVGVECCSRGDPRATGSVPHVHGTISGTMRAAVKMSQCRKSLVTKKGLSRECVRQHESRVPSLSPCTQADLGKGVCSQRSVSQH